MSPINKITILGVLILAGVLVHGCGSSTPNSQASFSATAQRHPAGWLPVGHAQPAKANPATCTECHGSDLSGGISGVSCTPCHLNGSPFVLTNCTSCHGNPPSGTAAPNRAGAHAAHNVFPNGVSVCDTCHSGSGSGTVNHDTGTVGVAFLAAFNAKSGTAVYSPDGTCSNVSCHGGQTTPGWLSGATIDVTTQCTACHSYGTSQYNSFVSGQHDLHVNVLHFPCVRCHDTVKLAVSHFTSLNTPAMEGPASATINSSFDYINGSCSPPCHVTMTW